MRHPLIAAAVTLWGAALSLALTSTFGQPVVSVGLVATLLAGAICTTLTAVIRNLFRAEVVNPTRHAVEIGARVGARFGPLDDDRRHSV